MSKLTNEEAAWIKKLQKVLDACPSDRIGAYTIGDANITLYDRGLGAEINEIYDSRDDVDFCKAVAEVDAELGLLNFPFPVESTAG